MSVSVGTRKPVFVRAVAGSVWGQPALRGVRTDLVADRSFLFHPPVGSPLAAVPPREQVVGAVAWLRNWAEENDLHLGPETNMPRWDGKSPDYELAVSGLLEAGCDVP